MGGADPDDLLVRRAADGDQAAFTELVHRHERRVFAVTMRMLGREEDALDATQDAFLTVFRKIGQFRGESAFSTWLHRIAVNACYDILRKKARQPALHLATEDDRPRQEGPPVADHAGAVAGELDVARALLEVPEDFRAVLVLADVHDLVYEEIAAILQIPTGTVKSRLHRGRLALARAMGLEAPESGREHGAAATPSEEP
ncbi:MAG: sigma-70 family RNA polymerase sigma factor [Actinomycetota bacterium]